MKSAVAKLEMQASGRTGSDRILTPRSNSADHGSGVRRVPQLAA
jgi:hypothetical protein